MTDIERNENALMETAMRIQEVFDDMYFAHHINPDISDRFGTMERYWEFIAWARDFEKKYKGTDRYEDDFLDLSYEFAEKKITEVFGNEVLY